MHTFRCISLDMVAKYNIVMEIIPTDKQNTEVFLNEALDLNDGDVAKWTPAVSHKWPKLLKWNYVYEKQLSG